MYTIRFNLKKLSIWILLFFQIFTIVYYFFLQADANNNKTTNRISFVEIMDIEKENTITYHLLDSNINLKSVNTKDSYIDFNSSLCFVNGTDLKSMQMTNQQKWQCNCLPGWHGNDCGQPEVLWRAILAYKKPIKVKGPRAFERRLIYLFSVDKFSENIADIRLNELGSIVDLFVLYEDENSDYLQNKLRKNFASGHHKKILYVKGKLENLWKLVKPKLKNLRNDDIILTSNSNEIPNKNALVFLKFYNQLPQPIKFRMRWSVFGFFWTHPSQTIIVGGACTVAYLKDNFDNRLDYLVNNKTFSGPLFKGIILGDLNHFGGWFCEHCRDAALTVDYLSSKPKDTISWDNIGTKKLIDSSFIEDLIENGLYMDGKTELKRAHRYQDNYFAPKYVIDNNFKYDFLLVNFYSKLDYYEG